MEWVETTAKSVEEAKEQALDQLGVAVDDAEFEVLEEPRAGLFGRLRGEARVRARVKPTPVRPKVDRRRGGRRASSSEGGDAPTDTAPRDVAPVTNPADPGGGSAAGTPVRRRNRGRTRGPMGRERKAAPLSAADPVGATEPETARAAEKVTEAMTASDQSSDVNAVRDAAVQFIHGLTDAFGFETTVDAHVDGTEIEVRVDGTNLGVLIGPGGRTLLSIQDLARVAAQRRLHDHDTRLRIDVAGYREKRRAALERFAGSVAEQVKSTGVARSLDPMPSADRKVIHDALAAIDGVVSRSEGEDPERRVVVDPAS